ncbi:MAG UNVERIFIED_CONTAM: hypothetical protein LVR29_18280 [Microcystis novacekii LVE1205-3]
MSWEWQKRKALEANSAKMLALKPALLLLPASEDRKGTQVGGNAPRVLLQHMVLVEVFIGRLAI